MIYYIQHVHVLLFVLIFITNNILQIQINIVRLITNTDIS